MIGNFPLVLISKTPIIEAIAKMREVGSAFVLITDSDISTEESRLIGILTKTDILRILSNSLFVEDLLLHDEMSYPVITIQETELNDVTIVTNLFQKYQISYLPILSGDRIVGVLTQDDLVNLLLQNILQIEENTQPLQQQELQSFYIQNEIDNTEIVDFKDFYQNIEDLTIYKSYLQKLVSTIPEVLYIAIRRRDGSIDITYISEIVSNLTEIESDAIIADSSLLFNLFHPDDFADYSAAVEQSATTLQPFCHEWRIITPSGKTKWISVNSQPERLDNQEIIWFGVALDVSDRKQAEKKLQELNQSLELKIAERTQELWEINRLQRAILDSSDYAIITCDLNGMIQSFNSGAESMLGYSMSEVVGNYAPVFFHDPLEIAERVAKLSAERGVDTVPLSEIFIAPAIQGIVFAEEWTYVRKDGSKFPIELTVSALRDDREQVIGFLGIAKDITERKRIELALSESNKRFRRVFDSNVVGIMFTDFSGHVAEANDYLLEMLGYSREDLEANRINWLNITPSEYIQQDLDAIEYIKKNGAIKSVEKAYYHKDGHLVNILVSAAKLSEQDDQCISVIIDISDLKKAELKIIEQDAQFQELSTASPSIIYTLVQDINGLVHFKYLNPIFEEITEISIVEAYQNYTTVFNQIHPDDKQGYQNALADSWQNMLPFSHEWRIVTYSGKTKWLKASSRPSRRDNGAIVWHGVIQDISILKDTEVSLRQKLAAIESAIDGIAILQENKYIYLNHSHLEIFGYEDHEELLGSSWEKLYPPETIAKIKNEVFPILERDRSWAGEIIATRKDGSTFHEGLSLTLTEDSLVICVCRDISELKQAEAKQHQTNKELIRMIRFKDQFLANMSHELRTPLNAILGLSEGLYDEVFGSLTQTQKNMIQTINSSGTHLLDLINDILDLSKIEAGEMTLHCQASNIQQLCQSSIKFVMQMAIQKNLQIELNCSPLIREVMLDERRIRQVLINLLSNAVKFTPEGGKITIEVSIEEDHSCDTSESKYWLCLVVSDTGIGISDEDLNKLFQPFIQVNNSLNRQYDGTGLGLALVKRIIELHGGYISVSSKVALGSQFKVKLPYTTSSLNSKVSFLEISTDRILEIDKFSKTPTILLLETKTPDSFSIASYLESRQYKVVTPSDDQQVMDIMTSLHPDLVIINLEIQNIDGLEIIKQIRLNNYLDIPIVALSNSSDCQKYLAQGANECLVKPFKLQDLFQIIQSLLEN